MNLQKFKQEALKNERFRKYYRRWDFALSIGRTVLEWRIERGLTQEELATLASTHQSSIARLENGQKLPSMGFLQRIAKVLSVELEGIEYRYINPKEHSLL